MFAPPTVGGVIPPHACRRVRFSVTEMLPLVVWKNSNESDTPLNSSWDTPTLNLLWNGRFRFGSCWKVVGNPYELTPVAPAKFTSQPGVPYTQVCTSWPWALCVTWYSGTP